jgi:hypothetical protein
MTKTCASVVAGRRVLNEGMHLHQYDAEGNRSLRSESATADYTVYEWDHRNQLVKVSEYWPAPQMLIHVL